MKNIPLIISALGIALTTFSVPAIAGNGNGNGNGNGHGNNNRVHCPPGLANRTPACVPPGQARKYGYNVGDRINDDYIIIRRPRDYGLDPNETYYRVGDYVYRVDRETREVLTLIGLIDALLN